MGFKRPVSTSQKRKSRNADAISEDGRKEHGQPLVLEHIERSGSNDTAHKQEVTSDQQVAKEVDG